MAQTWTAYYASVTFAATKNMAAVLNAHATEILKIRRVGIQNAQTAAVTGVLCSIEMRGYFSGSPGLLGATSVTPTTHDSTNTAPASATYAHAGAISGIATTFRRIFWSSDEAAIAGATMDELETLIPLNIIFDAGYTDANVQPMTLNQNQMAMVYNVTGAAGLLDTWIEFTKE
jgi:hypothetical protein